MAHKRPLMLIAGAGQAGREFAFRMAGRWRISVIDESQRKLNSMKAMDQSVACYLGDATSDLVLRKAGLKEAQVLVVVTGSDEANLEICRTGRRLGVPRILSLLINYRYHDDFLATGVELVSRPSSVASVLQTRLDPGRRACSELGLGRGELIEVRVLPHSPVVGKPLSHLNPTSWLVAAVYREGNLVVPHGQTVLEADDRVVLVGQPEVLGGIADYLRCGQSEFPRQYGTHIVMADPTGEGEGFSLAESFYLTKHTQAEGLKVLATQQQRPRHLTELSDLAEIELEIIGEDVWRTKINSAHHDYHCGLLVLPAPSPGLLDWLGLGHKSLFDILSQAKQPCLFSRGTFPYERILVATSSGTGPAQAVELAVEVARQFEARLTAVTCLPPDFVSGDIYNQSLRDSVNQAAQLGSLYSMDVRTQVLEGNPVMTVVEAAGEQDLLVISHDSEARFNPLTPDISRHLLLRCPCSVLVLSHPKETRS